MTSNLEKRVLEHSSSKFENSYTSTRRPVELVWSELFQDYEKAAFLEKKIKGWSRKKKQALMNGDFDDLPSLSRNRRNRESNTN